MSQFRVTDLMDKQPQIYSIDEVNDLIPSLEEIIAQLRALKDEIIEQKDQHDVEELTSYGLTGTAAAGAKERMDGFKRKIEGLEREFERLLKILDDIGCVLRRLEPGLIDFYGEVDGELAFLCWQEGDEELRYWHGLQDGFEGRKPIL